MFTILQLGVTWLASVLDQTWAALIVTGLMLVVALILEKSFFKRSLSQGFLALGFGRPNPRAILVACLIAVIMLAFFSVFSLITGLKLV
jgi:hypothetical protein